MAEDTKDEQLLIITKPEIISPYPNTPTSWETIHLPSSSSSSSSFQTQSQILISSDLKTWSTPPVPLIFPPTNHENLNFDNQDKKVKHKPNTASFDSTKAEIKPALVVELNRWWVFLQLKLPGIVANLLQFFVMKGRVFWSFGFPVLMVLLYFRRRRRRRLSGEGVDELLGVIKEKDERIRCLLYQIARMNELLLATHHGVPPMISKAVSS